MNKALISLSFDDARKTQYMIAKDILFNNNIPATFNITTGFIDGTCPYENIQCFDDPMSIEDVQWLNNQPLFEIALHGDKHLNSEEDNISCFHKLQQWLYSENIVYGFASPGTGLKDHDSDFWLHNVAYIRLSFRLMKYKSIKILARKASRILHRPYLYKLAYKDTLMDTCSNNIIYSVPVLKDITYEELASLVMLCVKQKKALVFMFHSIGDGEDNWYWSLSKFEKLIALLKQLQDHNQIDICTTMNLYQKIKENQNA